MDSETGNTDLSEDFLDICFYQEIILKVLMNIEKTGKNEQT